jgi:hypothetical protein
MAIRAVLHAIPGPLTLDLGRAALVVTDKRRDFPEPRGIGEGLAGAAPVPAQRGFPFPEFREAGPTIIAVRGGIPRSVSDLRRAPAASVLPRELLAGVLPASGEDRAKEKEVTR